MLSIFIPLSEITLLTLVILLVFRIRILYTETQTTNDRSFNNKSAHYEPTHYKPTHYKPTHYKHKTEESNVISISSITKDATTTSNSRTSSKASSRKSSAIIKYLTQGSANINTDYELKMESLNKAQIFAGTQLLEIKRAYGDLHQDNLAWLREAISLYLIGAIDFIGKQANCGTQIRKELVNLVLKSNLKLSSDISATYLKEALFRKLSSDNDLMVRAGAKAAKIWLNQNTVPIEMSLSRNLDDWGVFA